MEANRSLLIMIAHERAERLTQVTQLGTKLGHQVIERSIGIIDVGRATIEARPGVAIVIDRLRTPGLAVDRQDREGGDLPGDRDPRRAGSRVHQ